MKCKIIILLIIVFSQSAFSQQGFQLETNKKKIAIPFQLINNLVFIPIDVNGVELNFLLDTGVEQTILLSLDDKESLSLNNAEKISLRGLGSDEAIEGLKSTNNILSIDGFIDRHHDLYIVVDQKFNFSSHIGIPVNGIIGYNFFKNNLIEINYDKKKIFIYKDEKKIQKKLDSKYLNVPISIEKSKPYVQSSVTMDNHELPAKLLIDLGNSDALWIFQNNSEFKVPQKNFDDFLGKGFSGDVVGKRARITQFKIKEFKFDFPIIAMPDSSSIKSVNMVQSRVGSIGGEILKRFSVVFDYRKGQMYLRKGSNFDVPFQYNMSGIELQNEGMQWVQETVELQTVHKGDTFYADGTTDKNAFKYKFSLKPIYTIANIRKDSPAEICGLRKDDIVININNVPGYKYSLQGINEILKSEEGRWITFEIERNSQVMKFKFQLKSLL